MARKMPEWLQPGLWGVVIGATVVGMALFSTGWAVTESDAQKMAAAQSDKAVLAALTPICVAQFKQATGAGEQRTLLVALQDEKRWDRDDFVSERGWATMPGTPDPNGDVANACAIELVKLAD